MSSTQNTQNPLIQELPVDPEISLEATETPVSVPAEDEAEGLNITDESASLDDIKEEE